MTRGAPIPETVTLHVPFRVVKRGGRKEMQFPEGAAQPRLLEINLQLCQKFLEIEHVVTPLAKGWRNDTSAVKVCPKVKTVVGPRLPLETNARVGELAAISELAEREGIAPSYMTRVLRLTLLAPDIVETILDGRQGPEVTLARLLGELCWELGDGV